MSAAEGIRALAEALSDDDIYRGLDPVLRAHLEDRVSMNPSLRQPLAVAALGRVFGWEDQ